jgi:enterochelin esterase-like enzyme
MPIPTTPQAPDADAKAQEDMVQKDKAAFAVSSAGNEPYTFGPDSTAQDGVPRGAVTLNHWTSEHIYLGTERDYWLYIPKPYDGTQLACLMVFQDGELYLSPLANIPVLFDNLIYQQPMLAASSIGCHGLRRQR